MRSGKRASADDAAAPALAASGSGHGGGKMRRKGDLPSKPCARCGRPFTWRRKWARDWEQVRYCSEACRRGSVD